ncbi:hypothetical protein XENORESO_003234 [Xenotaenia resolanae]|uniref:Fibronectin type-III domain-containing protein n=1 Tax=Xenotaenia resolanae TaxID=208358 RepID=A0ABV0WJS9_9TELE
MSNPPATMLWRRERFTISEGTPHMQIYGTEGKSVLEVGTDSLMSCLPPIDSVGVDSILPFAFTTLHHVPVFSNVADNVKNGNKYWKITPDHFMYHSFVCLSQTGGKNCCSYSTVTPMSDRDFGRYNCTARNNIGVRYQEFILAQAGALTLSLMRSMPSVFSPDRMENTIHIFSQPVCNPLPPYQGSSSWHLMANAAYVDFIAFDLDVPSNPYSVRLSAVSQRLATVTFMKPDSHGGVPISYYLVQYKELGSIDWRDVKSHSVQTTVVLTGLEPNTTYEVRVAAVNGKGQGEFSHMETFQTLPIREPSPPAVHGQRGMGKAYRLGLVKQDDGGMPIVEYIVKYKTDKEEQWMTKLVPGANDFAMLQPLQWNTRYEVEITARNVKGLSEPTFYQFFMPQKPDITGKNTIKVNIVLQFTFLFHMAAEGFLEVLKVLLDFFMWNAVIFLSW